MEINASLVKKLREMTDAGMMDCKKALVEVGGDLEKAVVFLREKGLSKAAKKADRIASEGAIYISISDDFSKACMAEINSETDFVAKNENFINLGSKVINALETTSINSIEELNEADIDGARFSEYLQSQIAIIGENIVVRRIAKLDGDGVINGYLHSNKKVGALVALSFKKAEFKQKIIELSKNLCMHISAMKPQIVSFTEFSDEFIKAEKAALIAEIQKDNEEAKRLNKPLKNIPEFISQKELTPEILASKEAQFKENLKAQNKPEKIWDKIIPGMLERFIADNTLLDQRLTLLGQFFVLDDKKTIKAVLDSISKELDDEISVVRFVRFELGEGIQKREENFAQEVANQMK